MQRRIVGLWALLLVLFIVGCGGGGSGGSSSGNHWTIKPEGGTFHTSANEVQLVVPAGAVASNTTVDATKLTTAPTPPAGMAYATGTGWTFTHVNFTNPAALTMSFPAGTPDTVKIYRRADGASEWLPLTTTVNAGARTATAQVSSFSSYALFYPAGTGWNWTNAGGTFLFETLSVALPAEAVTTNVEVQPRFTPAPFTPPSGWTAVAGTSFDLGSSNPSLLTEIPFTATITYDAVAVPPALRDHVRIFYKENETAEWVGLTSMPVAADLNVSAASLTLGTFAVFYPTPTTASAYWVEQRNIQNTVFLDIYGADSGGTETLLYSPPQMQETTQLRNNTFRWSDKSFLGLNFADPLNTYLTSVNIATGAQTQLFLIPRDAGTVFSSVEPVRSNHSANGDDYALQVSQRNPTTGEARDQLLVFKNGSTTPTVLLSQDRTDDQSPMISRPWDVAADGRVLALTLDGLILFAGTGSTQFTIVPAELGPGEAYFSPDGTRVLFVQRSETESGWKVYNIATNTITTIPGLNTGKVVRWATNTQVISATYSGDDRRVEIVDVATGTASLITTAGAHPTSFINDVGVR
jgi:hypothetical protein